MHSSQDASDIVAGRVAHIPLVVYVPWLPQSHGQRVSALVEAVDFMPSLIDLAGIAHTVPDWKQLEGDSFVPLLLNPSVPAASWKPAVFTQCNRTPLSLSAQVLLPLDNAASLSSRPALQRHIGAVPGDVRPTHADGVSDEQRM